jgi:hypothetical protein
MAGHAWGFAFVVVLSGCLDVPEEPPAQAAAAGDASADRWLLTAETGLFDASPEGLVRIDSLPGLTVTQEGGTTRYDLDVGQILLENQDVMFLVQPLANATMPVAYDVDVQYIPPVSPGSDFAAPDAVCLGTNIRHDEGEGGFYLARALGEDSPPPQLLEPGAGYRGNGIGHGRAGPTPEVIRVFGDRFTEAETTTLDVAAGGFVRFTNFLSQIEVRTATMAGNHWWQNWTVDVPHRLLRVPSAPLYCASGFGEFQDATIVGKPPFETTVGGFLEVETLYGSSVGINHQYAPDANPANVATARLGDLVCLASEGRPVAVSRFEASLVRVDVERWVGHTFLVVIGMGPGQEMFVPFPVDHCPG